MAYLNGINYPKFFCYRTLFVKIFGLCLAVSAGLCVGKEGPLAHIGAIIGHAVVYLPINALQKFRNAIDKREIACAGAAAGVAAAFGSPIGGTLLIYEASRPSTFWSFGLTWKIFFASSIRHPVRRNRAHHQRWYHKVWLVYLSTLRTSRLPFFHNPWHLWRRTRLFLQLYQLTGQYPS